MREAGAHFKAASRRQVSTLKVRTYYYGLKSQKSQQLRHKVGVCALPQKDSEKLEVDLLPTCWQQGG